MTYSLLDLFSGIGGFSLGLERTGGFKTVAFCEIDKKAQQVLNKHWPDVPVFDDITTLTKEKLDERGISVDAICGGFPCQDISLAGRGAGIEGKRSGLWTEYARLIGELRPRFVFVENVSALLSRGLDRVLGDLAALGYDAEWHCIPASAIGAPHRRDRIWIMANPSSGGFGERDHTGQGQVGEAPVEWRPTITDNSDRSSASLAHPDSERELQSQGSVKDKRGWISYGSQDVAYSYSAQLQGGRLSRRVFEEYANACSRGWWETEPSVGRVAYGVPGWSHRLKQLGNAVVPQIPELLGRVILESEGK